MNYHICLRLLTEIVAIKLLRMIVLFSFFISPLVPSLEQLCTTVLIKEKIDLRSLPVHLQKKMWVHYGAVCGSAYISGLTIIPWMSCIRIFRDSYIYVHVHDCTSLFPRPFHISVLHHGETNGCLWFACIKAQHFCTS